ncbi:ethanolamine kinase isoform X1 [Euwallacea fornicatus]|uniref:ethanolamine kinase isoform X1 n=2 Tax=Euwallacea fornicatus TaxID=995702 RepID=UPI00338F2EC5
MTVSVRIMENRHQGFEHISVTVNENDLESGALKILQIIRPQWQVASIRFKLLTDGITNKLIGCLPDDAPETETVLVRVYGNKTDLLIDRKAETRNILLLSKHGLAPNLYATFENGLAYRFQPGCTLTKVSVRRPEIYSLVAKKMARLHKVKVDAVDKPSPFIWKKSRDFLNLVPEEFSAPKTRKRYKDLALPSQTDLNEEIIELQKILEKTKTPVVFCHNDLLLGNVVFTEEENDVTFIDYEYAAFNYQPYDIANHFAEFVGIDVNQLDYSKDFPSKDFQKDWIRVYLQEFNGSAPDENQVEDLCTNVIKFVLVSHLFWGIWALIQAEHSNIEFDYLLFAKVRLDEYFAKKREYLSANPSKTT